jgi:hypothetical protein
MTATVNKWANVGVAIQSALAAPDTISAITKANPAVVTSTAHGWNNGDYVRITALGMFQVNGRIFRVANVTANTAELEGEDSTLYDTFSSGVGEVVTFGTTMTSAVGLTASGGDPNFIDITTIHQNVRTEIPGTPSAANYSFECLWDAGDSALLALKSASDSQAQRAVKFAFSTGQKVVFNGYVSCTMLPTGTALDKVLTKVDVTMFGRPSIYAT